MFIIVFPGLELNVLHSQYLWLVIGDWVSLSSLYLRPRLGSQMGRTFGCAWFRQGHRQEEDRALGTWRKGGGRP